MLPGQFPEMPGTVRETNPETFWNIAGDVPEQFQNTFSTPYSMNSLFSELFRKFGGVFLEGFETISGWIWEVSTGKIKENYAETNQKKYQNSC